MFKMPFPILPFPAALVTVLRLSAILAVMATGLAEPAMAKPGNGHGWGHGGNGGGEEEEEPPVEPTGITHVIYFIGTAFFPDQVHVERGDTLMFTNLTYQNQMVEADDRSWSSGILGYGGTYPIMLDNDKDLDFTGKTQYSYGWYTYEVSFDGEAVEGTPEQEVYPSYPYLNTSLAETFNITEAVRRIEKTRALVYTVDENGNVITAPPTN